MRITKINDMICITDDPMTPEKHDISSLCSVNLLKNKDLSGRTVLLRLDLNMPMVGDKILDQSRLDASLDTLRLLMATKAHIVMITHRGRPKEKDLSLSLRPLMNLLELTLKTSLIFAHTVEDIKDALANDSKQKIILLENIRFFSEETTKNESQKREFAKALRDLADIYVNEAFSVSHRPHMSVYDLPLCFDQKHRYAGITFAREVNILDTVIKQSKDSNLITLMGGGKVSTKIGLLKYLLQISQNIILGGGMANTFLVAIGKISKGRSLFEEDFLDQARALYKDYASKIILPVDGVVMDDAPSHIAHDQGHETLSLQDIQKNHAIVDIGPETLRIIKRNLDKASATYPQTTILWNGPFGWIERPPFDQGSKDIAHILAECSVKYHAKTIVGGGETLSCLGENRESMTFASTAGGAFLEYLEKGTLFGVEILKKI